MASPNDNIQLRDGLDALFKMRTKDTSAAQDGSLQNIRHLASLYPVDYGLGGCFQMTVKSGTMAAGLAANSTILSMRWTSTTMLALIRRMRMSMWSLTGFTAGMGTIELYRATSFTVADTGGGAATITSPNGKLRSDMAAIGMAEIRLSSTAAMTAGTRTLDTNPLETKVLDIPVTANKVLLDRVILYEKFSSEHPLTLAQNQGLVVRATVPATGTWGFAITPEWDEVPVTSY